MSEDFVTRLEHQLSDAERRIEHGSRLRRIGAAARVSSPSRAALLGLAAAAALVVAVVLGIIALQGGDDDHALEQRHPTVVARVALGHDDHDGIVTGLGGVWIAGGAHHVLHLDASTRKVVGRADTGDFPTAIAVAAGSVWAGLNDYAGSITLLRIDPGTNRVADRTAIPARLGALLPQGGLGPTLAADGDSLWMLGGAGAVHVDASTGKVTGSVRWRLGAGVEADVFALAGDDLWVHAVNGRLLRFDARSGEPRGGTQLTPGGVGLAAIPGAGVIAAASDGKLTRISADTRRPLWTTQLPGAGTNLSSDRDAVAIVHDVAWALSENSSRGTKLLTGVDLATGKIVSTTALPEPGAHSLTNVDGDLWFTTPGGEVVVMRP